MHLLAGHSRCGATRTLPQARVGAAERLLARGYSDDDVHAILGENFLRVFEEVFG